MGIIAYSWETAAEPFAPTANIKPMYVCRLSRSNTMNELATEAYAAIAESGAPLFLRHFGEQRSGVADLKNDTYYDFMVNGPRVAEWTAAMEDFWVAWAQAGSMRPSRIILEFEKHYVWYAIPGGAAVAIQAVRDAGYSRRYPAEMNTYTYAQLAAHNNHTSPSARALVLHDHMAKQRMNKAITEAVLGTYATIMGEAPPPSSNYGDRRLRDGFTSYDGYAYPGNKVLCVGSDSSPDLYFGPNGARFSAISGDGPKQFAATKCMIEQVRACRGAVVPWVGIPSYRGGGFDRQTTPSAWAGWRKFIHTMALHGVSEVLYFIGDLVETSEERAYADETFATAVVATPNTRHRWNKPTIDTATLVTGTGGYVETEFPYSINDWS